MPGEDETNDLQVQEDKTEKTDASLEDRNPAENFWGTAAVNIIQGLLRLIEMNKLSRLGSIKSSDPSFNI